MKPKVLVLVFCLLCALCVPFLVLADEPFVDGDYFYTVEQGEATLVGASKTLSGDVELPAELGGYPVVAVGASAFEDALGSVNSLTIPEGVVRVEEAAFAGNFTISALSLPESLKSIEACAFQNAQITELTIPEGVEFIGASAFYGNPIDVLYFNAVDCEYSHRMNEADCAPFKEGGLKKVVFGDRVTSVSKYLFYACTKLSEVEFSESIQAIGEGAFGMNFALETVEFTKSPATIGAKAFYDCRALTTVKFGEGLDAIGENAFLECGELTDVSLPASLKTVGNNAFYKCYKIAKVEIASVASFAQANYVSPQSNPAYYAKSLSQNGEKITALEIPNGVSSVGQYAFYRNEVLTSVDFPATLKTIGYAAFADCTNLTDPEFPNAMETLEGSAFSGCTALRQLEIPASVESIEAFAFSGCSGLGEVKIYGSPVIATHAFADQRIVFYGYADSTVKDYADSLANYEFTELGATEKPEVVIGDCDGDGKVTANDLTTLAKYLAGWEEIVLG